MARRKQAAPMQRIPSGEVMESLSGDGTADERRAAAGRDPTFNDPTGAFTKSMKASKARLGGATFQLMVCVAGIYASL